MGRMSNGEQWLVTIDQAIDETNESRRKWIICKTSKSKRNHGSMVLPWVLSLFHDFHPWKLFSFICFSDFQWPSMSDQVVPTYINEVSPTALRGALGAVFQLACVPLALKGSCQREGWKGGMDRDGMGLFEIALYHHWAGMWFLTYGSWSFANRYMISWLICCHDDELMTFHADWIFFIGSCNLILLFRLIFAMVRKFTSLGTFMVLRSRVVDLSG